MSLSHLPPGLSASEPSESAVPPPPDALAPAEVAEHIGGTTRNEEVQNARHDPTDIGRVAIFDRDGHLICEAEDPEAP